MPSASPVICPNQLAKLLLIVVAKNTVTIDMNNAHDDNVLQAIRYSRGKLQILDQRALPFTVDYIDVKVCVPCILSNCIDPRLE